MALEPAATDASMLTSDVDRVTPNPRELALAASKGQLFQYVREPTPRK